jgi:predicted ATP-binding protein involved in virulence
MFVEKLRLENIKCFEILEISFRSNDNTPAKWVTLLGENATGKTTVLQSLALLIVGIENTSLLLSRPDFWLTNENNFGKLFYLCLGSDKAEYAYEFLITGRNKLPISPDFRKNGQEFYMEPAFVEQNFSYASPPFDTHSINENTIFPIVIMPETRIYPGYPFLMASAYGAYRRLSKSKEANIPTKISPERYAGFLTLFNDDESLATFEHWVVLLEFQAGRGSDKEKEQAKRKQENGIRAINSLLPEGVMFSHIDNDGLVYFSVNSVTVPTPALSDGYRSILALGGDLIWRLINAYPDSYDPTQEEGVVLIDELDIHLHPRWQAWIAQKLRMTFPNIQFIVATHSPLVAMGAGPEALTIKLEMQENGAVTARYLSDLSAQDVNSVLDSDAFSHVAPYAPEVQKKINRYDALVGKQKRNQAEEAELEELRDFIAKARPFGGPPEPGSLEARIEGFLDKYLP